MPPERLRELLAWAAQRFGKHVEGGWILMLGAFEYNALEEKLVRLALDCAASEGEIQNSAVALIRSLRARGVRPEALMLGSEVPQPPPRPAVYYGATRMPWGKYEDRRIDSIPHSYLRFVLQKCTKADPMLLEAIRRYLRQVQGG